MTFLISVPFSMVSAEVALKRRTRLSLSAPLPCADNSMGHNTDSAKSDRNFKGARITMNF